MNRCCIVFFFTAVSLAQIKEPSDAWLMRNYRFARPPAPGEIKPVGPALAQLQEIQNTTLNILHKSNYDWDYEAALAAAAQATATAQLIGALTGEFRPAAPPPPQAPGPAVYEQEKTEPRLYLVAFTDNTIQAVTAVWADRLMLHYMTRQGAHEQVRLDRVDWKLSEQLNRQQRDEEPAKPVRAGLSQ
jgi:hypothetical protein